MKHREFLFGFTSVIVLVVATVCQAQGSKASRAKKSRLPAAVTEAIRNECPNCEIARMTREKVDGIVVYDFVFRNGQGEMDIAADGAILEREKPVPTSEIPAPALEAIRNGGGSLLMVETDDVRAEIQDGKVVKLNPPRILYEADLIKDKTVVEIVVTADGQVIEPPKWKTKVRRR